MYDILNNLPVSTPQLDTTPINSYELLNVLVLQTVNSILRDLFTDIVITLIVSMIVFQTIRYILRLRNDR